ncbi:hypothetical protein LINPERHAP2_LOCUS35533 [Linum perenne]
MSFYSISTIDRIIRTSTNISNDSPAHFGMEANNDVKKNANKYSGGGATAAELAATPISTSSAATPIADQLRRRHTNLRPAPRPHQSPTSSAATPISDQLRRHTYLRPPLFDEKGRKGGYRAEDHLLALKKGDDFNNPDEVPFDSMEIWVQLHNIPARYKTLENIKMVANTYFRFIDVDKAGLQPGTWHRFVRVWVEIDLREPLPDYFIIPTGATREKVSIVNEKAIELCKSCSRLGHVEYGCQEDPGSPWSESDLIRTEGYLRSPGGTHYGHKITPVNSPTNLRSTPGASNDDPQAHNLSPQGTPGSVGYCPPTATSRNFPQTVTRGTIETLPQYFTPTFKDFFPPSENPAYNSKIQREGVALITPRNLGLEMDSQEAIDGSLVRPGPRFPPGFEPKEDPKSASAFSRSDHSPLIIDLSRRISNSVIPFRFDTRWLKQYQCEEIVKESWEGFGNSGRKLEVCRQNLKSWAKSFYAQQHQREKCIKERLLIIQWSYKTREILEEQTNLEREIETLWKDEELLWRQRANLNWTLEDQHLRRRGDPNISDDEEIRQLLFLRCRSRLKLKDKSYPEIELQFSFHRRHFSVASKGCGSEAIQRPDLWYSMKSDKRWSLPASSSLKSDQNASSSSGPCDVAVELDVSADGAAIDKAVQKAWEAFGRIDAVINNAGIRVQVV